MAFYIHVKHSIRRKWVIGVSTMIRCTYCNCQTHQSMTYIRCNTQIHSITIPTILKTIGVMDTYFSHDFALALAEGLPYQTHKTLQVQEKSKLGSTYFNYHTKHKIHSLNYSRHAN